MIGFIIFAIVVLFLLTINATRSHSASHYDELKTHHIHNIHNIHDINGTNYDAATKHNTAINSVTATTTTKVEPFLRAGSVNIINADTPTSTSSSSKTKSKTKSNKKIRFSNNVNVRLFDKSTRDILGDDKTNLITTPRNYD
jgi:hypothetical protein